QPAGASAAFGRGFFALEQAAVDEQAVLLVHAQLMAGAGDAVPGTMVDDLGVHGGVHGGVNPLTIRREGNHGSAGEAKAQMGWWECETRVGCRSEERRVGKDA